MQPPSPLLVLGVGYVGQTLLAGQMDSFGTRRPGKPLGRRLVAFDLADERTWRNIDPKGCDVVWTFPAEPLDRVKHFFSERLGGSRSVTVLGSTSAYLTSSADEEVHEESPLDLAQPRVAGEEWLRGLGATVLQLAGIFGPGREPVEWLRKGLITNGRKRVNLIHVNDIEAVIVTLIQTPQTGIRLNVSNGRSPRWNELVSLYAARGLLPAGFTLAEADPGPGSKRISNQRLTRLMPGHGFREP